jgi:hypothetical protein
VAFSVSGAAAQSVTCDQAYRVVRGDTLGAISERAYGAGSLAAFFQANKSVIGEDPNQIDVGMTLAVPYSIGAAPLVTARAVAQSPEASAPAAQADFSAAPLGTTDTPRDAIAAPEGAEVVLIFNKASVPNFIINVGIIDPYLAAISEATQGRVRFVDPPLINLDTRAQLDIVTSGQVDAAYVFNGYLSESHPLLQLPMQPLMGGTAYQTAVAMWELHDQFLSKTDYFAGADLLGIIGAPAALIGRLRYAPVVPGEDLVKSNEYTMPYFDGLDTRGAAAVREENASWLSEYDEKNGNPLTFAMAHGAARAGGI